MVIKNQDQNTYKYIIKSRFIQLIGGENIER
jgi:hypothetical protein